MFGDIIGVYFCPHGEISIIMITDSLKMAGILYSVLSHNKQENQNMYSNTSSFIFILNIILRGHLSSSRI